jgi:hypothetical protein
MSELDPLPGEPFALRFRRELQRRTGGRVAGLEIRCHEREVRVSCTVPSYHVKQLVIVAALTALDATEGHDVILSVRVSAAPPLAEGSGGDGASAGSQRLRPCAESPAPLVGEGPG